jgi:hypothetical protein
VSVRTSDEAAVLVGKLLAKVAEVSPRERFIEMVGMGLINRDGELTKEFGGDAETELQGRPSDPPVTR